MRNPPPPFTGNCEVFSPCWCAVAGRENNPHCKASVPINDYSFILVFATLATLYGLYFIHHYFKNKKPTSWETRN